MASSDAPSLDTNRPAGGMATLIRQLVRPYRRWLVVILLAMLVETAMSLAGPWPLKIILDNAVGTHRAPEWLVWLLGPSLIGNKMALAAAAACAAVLGAVASYIDNYFTESVGQWVARDLVGGGEPITRRTLAGAERLALIPFVFLLRFGPGAVSYAAAIPGGLFASMLVLGTRSGVLFGTLCGRRLPSVALHPMELAVAADRA